MDVITLTIGFASTGITLLVTVILFAIDRVSLRRREVREARRQLVARVLDALDLSARALARPAFTHMWTNPDVEYALVIPRLLLELDRKDRVVASWLQRQTQLMLREPSKRKALAIRAEAAGRFVEWHQGERRLSWFREELKRDPVELQFKVGAAVRAKRLLLDSWSLTQWLGVLAGLLKVLQSAVRSWAKA
jgi:hypothetical protein